MMLKLIGLGLSLDLLPLGNIVKLLECDEILVDTYTSIWFPSLEELANFLRSLNKNVLLAKRSDLEGEAVKDIIARSQKADVCIVSAGDPLIATTHIAIAIEAASRGIEVEIAPASSILNVGIALSCLQVYRFGKIVTLVKPREGIVFEYPLMVIKENRNRNLHTLLLLDIDVELGYFMTPDEALRLIFDLQHRLGIKVLKPDDKIIVLEAIGCREGKVIVDTAENIMRGSFNCPPYTLIIPAERLHPIEQECLEALNRIKYVPRNQEIFHLLRVLHSLKP